MRTEKENFNAGNGIPTSIMHNLVSWHGFDGNLHDSHGAAHAELVEGEVAFGTNRFQKPNAALVLAGSSGLIFKGVAINGRSFSIQFWALNPQKWLLAQGIGEDGFGLHIGVGPAGMRCDYWGNDLIAPLGKNADWTHWVMVHDVDTGLKSTWRDGVCVAQMESAPYRGTGDFTLGRHFSGVGYYSGRLDDIAIWIRAIEANEIAILYGNAKGPSYKDLASA